MERRRFRVLEKERDVTDAQGAILKQGACEITSHVVENTAEWGALLGQTASQRPPAYPERCGDCVERHDRPPETLDQEHPDACTQFGATRLVSIAESVLEPAADNPLECRVCFPHRT